MRSVSLILAEDCTGCSECQWKGDGAHSGMLELHACCAVFLYILYIRIRICIHQINVLEKVIHILKFCQMLVHNLHMYVYIFILVINFTLHSLVWQQLC